MAIQGAVSAVNETPDEDAIIAGLVERARAAMDAFADADQQAVNDAVTALAWAIYEPGRARKLAEVAVEDTGLGVVEDKVIKNTRKTKGTLRDLLRPEARSVGIIDEAPDRGLVRYAKPVGVVAAVCPSTNPAATPVNKAMLAVKGKNAVIIAPSPAGLYTTAMVTNMMRAELERAGFPADLVQVLPPPVTKTMSQNLMEACDLVVVTGSQNNVRRAYTSGKPAIGVGAGNVPVIIDSTADLADAAKKIHDSKTFDNATSCSSENAIIIVDDVFDDAIKALEAVGGYMTTPEEKNLIGQSLWVDGNLNRKIIAKDADVFAAMTGLPKDAAGSRFFMVEEKGVGKDHPFSGEKLSLALTIYRAKDFDAAILQVQTILDFQGAGHSCGLHTQDMDHARRLAEELDVVRVLINQAHAFGNGGSFDNGLNFTLTMGCGTWAGNSISENLNYRNFINITHLSTVIPNEEPADEELFGPYFGRHGA
jgi:sulfoacetaldehyde dehydrogenase